MVASDWQHPKDERGRYIPKHNGSYEGAAADWHEGYANFKPDEYCKHYWEYSSPPDSDRYMYEEPPDPATLTHFQMYENTSEGTPISPVFDNIESLARWLADTGAGAFGGMTATYEEWLSTCQRGWAISGIGISGQGITSGVAGQHVLAPEKAGNP
jgi:hypothetical protein